MINLKKSKAIYLLLCAAMLFALSGCGADNKKSTAKAPESSETSGTTVDSDAGSNGEDALKSREDSLKQMEEIEKNYQQNPNDQTLGLEYAQKLFEFGEFSKLQEVLKPLLDGEKSSADAMYLSAQTEYLTGNYDQAEKMYKLLAEQYPDEFKTQAEAGLVLTYYQTNQYQKSQNLFKGLEDSVELPIWDMMKDFGDVKPYQIDWKGKKEVVVPFVVTDPLPIIPIEINGKRINAIIDTGGPMFVIEEKLAASLGINAISKQEGVFAGGQTAEISYGRADSLAINGVTINEVPVMIGPFSGFTGISEDEAVNGIIGTNVLEQFVVTIDYLSGQLILRPRNEMGRDALKAELAQQETVAELPFVLSGTHHMFSKGSINGIDGFHFFVDSGLGDTNGAAVILPKETMDYVGIPIPEMKDVSDGNGGMGGADYQEGYFDMDSFGLGNLQHKNGVGVYHGEDYAYDEETGFFNDGLISHNFLKKYKWTIDFDSMKMIFSQ